MAHKQEKDLLKDSLFKEIIMMLMLIEEYTNDMATQKEEKEKTNKL